MSKASELNWQNAPQSDKRMVAETLQYVSASIMDYSYLVGVVAALIAAEREACAQIVESGEYLENDGEGMMYLDPEKVAAAIRARGTP